jgi:HD superfamily phosphodiesterase
MTVSIDGVSIPDSALGRAITELVRDTESPLLFHHSSRVFYFGALAGKRRGLRFDAELLYAGAMFHDMGLTHQHSTPNERFEVDSANAARDFLHGHGISHHDLDTVWTAIALHTTPGIPQHMHPVVALLTNGVEMDVLGIAYSTYTDAERNAVVHAHPRPEHFKEEIIQAFYDGNKHKPETTFGNVNADVLADKDPHFHQINFCSMIRGSAWKG